VVTRGLPGSFRCKGNQTQWTDFSVFVDVTLINKGSCAGVWFRFALEKGYALRICENGYYLVIHGHPTSATITLLREFRFIGEPVPLGAKTRVGITMEGSSFRFYRDGKLVGQFVENEITFARGRITMGVFQVASRPQPPYQVAFTDLEILTPTGF
jgi:eukaryotic-like serine/threonine-protein kinase